VEAVIGQLGVLLSDEQRLKEAFGCQFIILNCDLETLHKGFLRLESCQFIGSKGFIDKVQMF